MAARPIPMKAGDLTDEGDTMDMGVEGASSGNPVAGASGGTVPGGDVVEQRGSGMLTDEITQGLEAVKIEGWRINPSVLMTSQQYFTCPYNAEHRVGEPEFLNHLNECRKEYLKDCSLNDKLVKIAICCYDMAHHVNRVEIDWRERNCPSQPPTTDYLGRRFVFQDTYSYYYQ